MIIIKAVIYYLGHSGWAVKTESHFLIFDYYEMDKNHPLKSLSNGYINAEEIKDENVFVFVSHKHQDHYDKIIHTWKPVINNITYISGWGSRGTDFIPFPPHSHDSVKDIKISTLKSTDEGSGFLVVVDGLVIYHAGDHANWEDNDPSVSYYEEMDYISKGIGSIDLAFIPVTTFSGQRPECMTEGAIYAIKKLNPKAVFPMHGNNREFLYKEFASEISVKNYNIICAEKPGHSFVIEE